MIAMNGSLSPLVYTVMHACFNSITVYRHRRQTCYVHLQQRQEGDVGSHILLGFTRYTFGHYHGPLIPRAER